MPEIRTSTDKDKAEIRAVHERAFGRKAEADLVETLMASNAFVPNLSLVAVNDGKVAGHILYTKVDIVDEDGQVKSEMRTKGNLIYAVALAPLAVLPELQKQGIGKALMHESLKLADKNGHGVIIVLGHPEYYPKFGFEPASQHGMKSPFDVPDNVFMVKPLNNFNAAITGSVAYHEAFNEID